MYYYERTIKTKQKGTDIEKEEWKMKKQMKMNRRFSFQVPLNTLKYIIS